MPKGIRIQLYILVFVLAVAAVAPAAQAPQDEIISYTQDGKVILRTLSPDGGVTDQLPYVEDEILVRFRDAVTVEVDPDLKPGFPVKAFHDAGTYQGGQAIHTLVGNIDDDPSLEIVVTGLAAGPLYAWRSDGSLVAGWPLDETLGAGYPALGELSTQSSGFEVISGYYPPILPPTRGVIAAYSGSGAELPGWPRDSANFITSPPALADVDGDGLDEVFIGEEDWRLHAYKSDGTPLPGWPVYVPLGGQERHTPAIADLDGDADLEIVTTSEVVDPGGVYLFAHHHDGTPVNGFPIAFDGFGTTFPVIGDVDGDGTPEIAVVAWLPFIGPGVHIISSNGTIKRSIATAGTLTYSTTPALADLDYDGVPEIIVQTDTALNVWRGDGSVFPGWPVVWGDDHYEVGNSSPVVGDVDGDGLPDIVVTRSSFYFGLGEGEVRVYNRNGVLHPRFPKVINIGSGAVPAIADIDVDGRNEIIVTGNFWNGISGDYDKVWVYDLGGPSHGPVLWGQFMGGPKHQGYYDPGALPQTSQLTVNRSGTGSGHVSGPGINCGSDCAENYSPGTVVTLTAAPDAGSTFVGWSGVCSGSGACTLTLNSFTTVTAIFIKPLILDFPGPPEGEVSVAYNASLEISGGLPPYTVSVISGALPPGLSLNSSNISGTPTAAGKKSFKVQVTDRLGSSASRKFKIKVYKPLRIKTESLKAGAVGKGYTATIKASRGKKPFTWSLVSGSLPGGLSIDFATGKITGIPTVTGSVNLTFQVSDTLGGQTQKNFTLIIN